MTEPTDAGPLKIDAAEYAPFGEARLVVELTGRWTAAPAPGGAPALLTLDLDGVVHRFPEIPTDAVDPASVGGEYAASFVVPAGFESRLTRSTILVAHGETVAVPAAARASADTLADLDPALASGPLAAEPPLPLAGRDGGGGDPTAAALRAELSQRLAEETRMRRELAELRTQLDARSRNQARLEATQSELRAALGQLKAGLERESLQRTALEASNAALESANASLSAELGVVRAEQGTLESERAQALAERDAALTRFSEQQAELAAGAVARETAAEEVADLRGELARLSGDLAEVREQLGSAELDEAEALLAETRALAATLQESSGPIEADDHRD